MRKIILSISFTLLLFSAFSQTTSNYDYLQAYRRFTLAGRSVKGISNDTAMLIGSADSLVTQYALKGYLAGHGIGIKGRQHQLLGAKADSTAEMQYLEPLVEGAFVISDSELNATTLVPAIYDLRNGQKWVSNNAGIFARDTSGASYFTDYGVRRFLYNPTTNKTFYVNGDSSWAQIGSGNVFNVHADTTIQNTYVTNDNSYYYSLSDSSWLDDRDFYNDGTITSPYRIRRYDNAYIDSLFTSIQPGGTGGAGTTVNNFYTSKLPYNGDSTYYLGGDTIPHKLPAYAGTDTTSLSNRINQKLNITDTAGKWIPIGTKLPNPIKLTTNGQNGPSTLDTATNTLNVPNYFFVTTTDSVDYSLSAMTTIYNEKGPGEYFPRGFGVTVNPDNFNFPFKQLKALDVGGWSAGDYVSFQNATTANSTAYTFMRAFIRLKQAVPVIQSLSFQFYLNGSAVSKIISMVNYGLDKSMINKYQNISIPMSAFGFTDNNFDEIRLIFGGGSSPDGLYLDLFQFQNATTTENKYVTDVFRIPGTTTVQKVLGGQNSFAFNDSVGAAVDTQYLRRDINLKLNTADTINKWMPRATPIVNAFNGRAGNVLPQSADYSPYYEPIIAGGTTAQYWRGDKTWQTLASVATSGSYTDLTNRPAITNGQVAVGTGTSLSGSSNLTYLNNLFKITNGNGGLTGYPNQTIIAENNGPMVMGVYSSSSNLTAGLNHSVGASYATGFSNLTLSNGNYPGFEMQHIFGQSHATNYLRFNFFERLSNGNATNITDSSLLKIYGNGTISIKTLQTNMAAPAQVGSVQMVTTDSLGNLSFQPIAGGTTTGGGTTGGGTTTLPGGSSGNIQFNSAGSFAGDNGLLWDNTNKQLHITTDATAGLRGVMVGQHNNGINGALMNFRKSRGTLASPLPTSNGDYGGLFFFQNYDGSTYRYNAGFGAKTSGTVGINNVPTELFFYTSTTDDSDPYTNNHVRLLINSAGSVGVNTTLPATSAILDVSSTSKGVLLPRMTKAQRDAIVSPAQGLTVFVTDNGGYLSYYNNGWMRATAQQDP